LVKTIGITGVATGIGADIARMLKQSGHRVIGFDIATDAQHVDRLIAIDLADPASVNTAIDTLDEPLHGLCNNAGIPPKENGSANLVLQVNFIGQRQFTQGLLSKLEPSSPIVNMASRAGHGWRENIQQILRLGSVKNKTELAKLVAEENINPVRAYNLSKEAMILWTLSETETLIKQNLRMNSISPGAVSTGILDDFAKAFGDTMVKNVARAGRPASAEEVAKVAVFLLSEQSSWLKGIDIPVDGGMGSCAATDLLNLSILSILSPT